MLYMLTKHPATMLILRMSAAADDEGSLFASDVDCSNGNAHIVVS